MKTFWTIVLSLILTTTTFASGTDTTKNVCIGIVALGKISKKEITSVRQSIAEYYKINVVFLERTNFPKNDIRFFSDTINSSDATNILKPFLTKYSNCDFILGLTSRPISIILDDTLTVHRGLGGSGTAIVSSYLIKKDATSKEEYFRFLTKVALHECGHLFGLGHCFRSGKCFMIGFNYNNKYYNESVRYGRNDIAKLYKTENKLCSYCQNKVDEQIKYLISIKKNNNANR